ncbi:GTPase Era [Aquisalimonas asiatica]|uniref:GTPase Era n=1 Tax=Aquisalimonas asiatica TaxID=406100 RepID=A0A1H8QD28_9GAMM|nr:GTPase Era [Aquisalimonas asiatica]SEO51911.1 GTP-binding protein Era [Aquisalimonas asiatica]
MTDPDAGTDGERPQRCGYIGLVGRPNVGKSTLLNRLLGMKLSIVSRRPQTTRNSILGVQTRDDTQFIYVDTPGLHGRQKKALNRYLNRSAVTALRDVDVVVMLVEPQRWTDDDELVLEHLRQLDRPVIAVVNKVDLIPHKEELLPFLEELAGRYPFREIIPLSAEKGQNVEPLEEVIRGYLPESVFYFPEEQVTDRSQRFLVAELIREQLMRTLGQEVPYSTSVALEAFEESDRLIRISAVIWVERDGQKAIVIGNGGQQLKRIGQQARRQIEHLVEKKVHLELWVKIREGWADDERAMKSLGYDEN